jgi:hypothetical protein
MDRKDVAILINSSPKYFYLLPLQLTMLRRYAPELKWNVYFATEDTENPVVQKLRDLDANILPLPESASGFLESRVVALQMLPNTIKYVLPLQEDFLLDRRPDYSALKDALTILDTDRQVSSLRLTPCPGPHESDPLYDKTKPWRILGNKDIYTFTYQATLWRRLDLRLYFSAVLSHMTKDFAVKKPLSDADKKYLALTSNIGENSYGQEVLKKTLPDTLHLSCPRLGEWSNAVYLCPWPYRPTAVTRGRLEAFAEELFQREGVKFEKPDTNMME